MPGIAVILGAGASYDCGDFENGTLLRDFQPPLVKDVFSNRPTFANILANYPKAASLASTIRIRLNANETLEDVLADLATAKNLPTRRQYWEVPLYLQDLFGEISQEFAGNHGTHYDVLALALARSGYDNILYITVNYDCLLERALQQIYDCSFSSLNDYCQYGRQWALVKLHGSVKWGRHLLNGHARSEPRFALDIPANVEELQFGDFETSQHHLSNSRFSNGRYLYPALSVPTTGKQEFTCPKEHLDAMHQRLADCSVVLVIGFSGLDTHVLRELGVLAGKVKRLEIVNGTKQAGAETLQRFEQYARWGSRLAADVVENQGFAKYVQTRLPSFLKVVG